MHKRFIGGLAALVASAALIVPAAGMANKGGVSHSSKPCPVHKHHGKHNGAGKGKKKGAGKGKKCGA